MNVPQWNKVGFIKIQKISTTSIRLYMNNRFTKHLKEILFFLLFGLIQMGFSQDWKADYNDAMALAKTETKPVILVFSGSDWCGPCIRFKKTILDTETFLDYASENYVLYNADFPRKKKNLLPAEKTNMNKSLAERYNPKGYFPLVVVLDAKESILGKTGFDRRKTPQDYIDLLNGYLK